MATLQCQLATLGQHVEHIEIILFELGALAITLVDNGHQPIMEPRPEENPIWDKTLIQALFPIEYSAEELKKQLNQTLKKFFYEDILFKVIEDQKWERAWLKYFKPIKIGEKLLITPQLEENHTKTTKIETSSRIIIHLDPGLAFGTGTHPTTQLCLEWLNQVDLNNKHCLDYGCGSGILSIAAYKLGASTLTAVDHCDQALLSCHDNLIKNDITPCEKNNTLDHKVNILNPESFQTVASHRFDLIVANILLEPLISLKTLFRQHIDPQGLLATSGILKGQIPIIKQAYEGLFTPVEEYIKDEWGLLVWSPSI